MRKSRTQQWVSLVVLASVSSKGSVVRAAVCWNLAEVMDIFGPQVCAGWWQEAPRPVLVCLYGAVTAGVFSQCVTGMPLARQISRRERHPICYVFCGLDLEDAELFPPSQLSLILACFLLLWQRQLRMGKSSRKGVYFLMVLEFLALCGPYDKLTPDFNQLSGKLKLKLRQHSQALFREPGPEPHSSATNDF